MVAHVGEGVGRPLIDAAPFLPQEGVAFIVRRPIVFTSRWGNRVAPIRPTGPGTMLK